MSEKAGTPSNMDYAKELVQFYTEHGHYAPTATIGGAGLTKWLAKMRDSQGAVGIVTALDSAKAASQYLSANIADFSWENTRKEKFNSDWGLSKNGYAPDSKVVRDRRNDEVKARITSEMSAPHPTRLSPPVSAKRWPHEQLMQIASLSKIPVRVVCEKSKSSGWFVASTHNRVDYRNQHGTVVSVAAIDHSHFASVHDDRFEQGFLQAMLYDDRNNCLGYLELDWVVADQFVGTRHALQNNVDEMPAESRLLSTQTTRFKAFIKNMRLLQQTIDDHVGKDGTPLHVGSSTQPVLFKFLEHAKRKYKSGAIGAAEKLMLTAIENCTIGPPKSAMAVGDWIRESKGYLPKYERQVYEYLKAAHEKKRDYSLDSQLVYLVHHMGIAPAKCHREAMQFDPHYDTVASCIEIFYCDESEQYEVVCVPKGQLSKQLRAQDKMRSLAQAQWIKNHGFSMPEDVRSYKPSECPAQRLALDWICWFSNEQNDYIATACESECLMVDLLWLLQKGLGWKPGKAVSMEDSGWLAVWSHFHPFDWENQYDSVLRYLGMYDEINDRENRTIPKAVREAYEAAIRK